MTSRPIRVLLADDHDTVREGLCALFSAAPEFELVADVKDGRDAVAQSLSLTPDVVVMDLSMPTSGLVSARDIKAQRPSIAIVVLSRHRDLAYVRAAFDAGAAGYVLKQSPFNTLKSAVLTAASGERFLDDSIRMPASSSAIAALSPRESEVLRRAAAGFANKEIAAELNISVKTVEAHKANAMRKLRLTDRNGVVRFAVMQGWLQE